MKIEIKRVLFSNMGRGKKKLIGRGVGIISVRDLIFIVPVMEGIQGDNHCFKNPFLKIVLDTYPYTREDVCFRFCSINIPDNRVFDTPKGIIAPTVKGEIRKSKPH
jgi:hypothetical protein